MKFVGGYLFAVLRTGQPGPTTQRKLSSFVSPPFSKKMASTPRFPPPMPLTKKALAIHTRRMSSSDDENMQPLIDVLAQIKHPYPLIDVDCNLLHEDLTSMLAGSTDQFYNETNVNLRILHHPSTLASHICGVFSPSSTISEAEKLHAILLESTSDSRCDIFVRMSVGVHPYHTEEAGDFSEEVEYNTCARIVALMQADTSNGSGGYIACIGEAGLDYSEGFPAKDKQLPWFAFQLRLAKAYNLPLFLHERLAFEDTIAMIDEIFPDKDACPPIIIHCFTGKKDECKKYIERGYHISVSGYILKSGEGPEEVQACLREGIIPIDKLMIETDAPYMGFNACRETFYQVEAEFNDEFQVLKSKKKKNLIKGMYPNVPSSLPQVFKYTVDLLNEGKRERGEEEISAEDAAKAFFDNSVKFFGFHK